jgi:CheY-like chemotaxis protein
VEVAIKPERTCKPTQGTETVLLVEDEPMLRELGLLVLSGLGYRVLPADNGVQALRVLEQHRGQPIHLLVTDVVMPEMGGKELSEHLRTVSPETKVLFCSGYTEHAILHEGALNQGVSFLQKPYTIATFASKVRAVLELVE